MLVLEIKSTEIEGMYHYAQHISFFLYWLVGCLLIYLFIYGRVLLCSLDCPETHYVD